MVVLFLVAMAVTLTQYGSLRIAVQYAAKLAAPRNWMRSVVHSRASQPV
jgi:hypothetical protein